MAGDGGTGKSLLALQLAVAVAAQTAWLGYTCEAGPATFLSAEDDLAELHRRLFDVTDAAGVDVATLDCLSIRSLAGQDALLATLQRDGTLAATALLAEIDQHVSATGARLIVLDTLADLFPGNENDRAQARQFIGLLRGLAIRNRCAVVVLSHPSLTGLNSGTGTSGSTGWNNSVRSRLYLSRVIQDGYEADPDARILTLKKSNYGRTGNEIFLRWNAGAFEATAPEIGLDRLAAGAKAERVFLKLLDTLIEQGRYVSASPGPTYAPTQFASHPEAEGMTKRALKSAMDGLFGRGLIVIASHGRGAKARTHIARKGGDHAHE